MINVDNLMVIDESSVSNAGVGEMIHVTGMTDMEMTDETQMIDTMEMMDIDIRDEHTMDILL